ncbi:MAG TPA: class I SAM-dependent methyltransferase, partial [Thiolapillus brandeum]|nr:class I SAM-dependent methyltransferase [Thiolapillus brandeum]
DFSSEMTRVAHRNFPFDNVKVVEADACHLPFVDSAFDMAVCFAAFFKRMAERLALAFAAAFFACFSEYFCLALICIFRALCSFSLFFAWACTSFAATWALFNISPTSCAAS